MAMGEVKGRGATLQVEMVCLDELVPVDDRYRTLDRLVDWSFVRVEAASYYADELGRPSVDPIVLVNLLLCAALEGLDARRELVHVDSMRPAPAAARPGRTALGADADTPQLERNECLAHRPGRSPAGQARPAPSSRPPRPGRRRSEGTLHRRLPRRECRRFRGRRACAARRARPLRLPRPELASIGADCGFAAERVWRQLAEQALVAYIPPQPQKLPRDGIAAS